MEVHGVLAGCGGKWSALWEWAVELVSVRLAVVWEGAESRSVPDPCGESSLEFIVFFLCCMNDFVVV